HLIGYIAVQEFHIHAQVSTVEQKTSVMKSIVGFVIMPNFKWEIIRLIVAYSTGVRGTVLEIYPSPIGFPSGLLTITKCYINFFELLFIGSPGGFRIDFVLSIPKGVQEALQHLQVRFTQLVVDGDTVQSFGYLHVCFN